MSMLGRYAAGMAAMLVVCPAAAMAQPALDAALHARRTSAPPRIDGRLDDEAWSHAVPLRSFVQNFPEENTAPTEATEVRVLYDDHALYVAIRCDDREAARIVAPIARRERPDLESDYVALQLDSRGDRRTAFGFAVTAAGVQFDNTIYDDTEMSLDWDAVWPSATSRDDRGWTAELAIPLDVLRFDDAAIDRWQIYVQRYISRRKELVEWPYLSRDNAAQVSRFGAIEGIDGLRPTRTMYLVPYVGLTSVFEHAETRTELDPSAGIDIKLPLTSGLTLDATVFPDFGQIESDQLVLNLTTFETYVREKRGFFLEGGDLFAPPVRVASDDSPAIQLFNSRRIGHGATIAGAGKLSGRIGDRTAISILDAVTLAGTTPMSESSSPLTSFSVARIRRDGAASHVGATAAVVAPLERRDEFPTSVTGGADFALQDEGRSYAALGQVVASARQGGTTSTVAPDGTVIGDGARGLGAQLQLAKQSGAWIGSLYQEYESPELDLEAAGYLKRQNFLRTQGSVTYRQLAAHGPFVESRVEVLAEATATADASTNVGRRVLVRPEATLGSFWMVGATLGGDLAAFDVRETGDGTPLARPATTNGEVHVTTDNRRRVFTTAYAQGVVGGRFAGERVRSYGGGADTTLRIGERTELLVGVAYARQVDPPRLRLADAATSTYYLAPLDVESASLTMNATVTITPTLTLQSFAQLLIADGAYRGSFAQMPGADGRLAIDALTAAPAPDGAAGDFEATELDAHLVMHWEYRPGSRLFAVVTHELRDRESTTALLLKLSYFWK
jgi:hypothetical protein